MKINIIAVGKLKEKYLKDGISEYAKRLSRFCDLDIVEVEDERAPEGLSPAQEEQIKEKEANRIRKRLKEGTLSIVLDLKGEMPDSEAFAAKMQSFFLSGNSHFTFIIGGSLGLEDELVKSAHYRFSLSRLTFPHQLARLVLLEQLFRSFKIISGECYHK